MGLVKYDKDYFIQRAKLKHGDTYDYSRSVYVNCDTKVCIICPHHGEFWQSPYLHVNRGHGCTYCGRKKRPKKMSKDAFVEEALTVHGDKYEYLSDTYVNLTTKMDIRCKKHGIFKQAPYLHLSGRGCNKCANESKKKHDTDSYIKKAIEVHGDRYDYSQIVFVDTRTKVKIICKIHGLFDQNARSHLRGQGCYKCKANHIKEKYAVSEIFITKATQKHGDKYDYSKVVYKNNQTIVTIICPKHGEFQQKATNHLQGKGCQGCGASNRALGHKSTTAEYVVKAKRIHGDRYIYDKCNYTKSSNNVMIKCAKHGYFIIIASMHLQGRGCQKCKETVLERNMNATLQHLCLKPNLPWKIVEVKYNKRLSGIKLRADFAVRLTSMSGVDKTIVIEMDGPHHFNPCQFSQSINSEEHLKTTKERDQRKYDYCMKQQISLLRIDYTVPRHQYESLVEDFIGEVCLTNISIYKTIGSMYKH